MSIEIFGHCPGVVFRKLWDVHRTVIFRFRFRATFPIALRGQQRFVATAGSGKLSLGAQDIHTTIPDGLCTSQQVFFFWAAGLFQDLE
jgi:hypothetical protein